ncbi:hypothetical protein B0H14DRAFT_2567733 [Mycena olivaceomarginata]|nr:hypothetical protein B0H14DRAFT_2567733 [Mycena olivaceomarginata]
MDDSNAHRPELRCQSGKFNQRMRPDPTQHHTLQSLSLATPHDHFPSPPEMEKITQFVDLCTATTATIAPPAAILGLAYFFVKWFSDEVLQNTYVSPPLFPQQRTSISLVLEELLNFALLSTSGKMTWTEPKEAFEAYYRSPSQPNVHSRKSLKCMDPTHRHHPKFQTPGSVLWHSPSYTSLPMATCSPQLLHLIGRLVTSLVRALVGQYGRPNLELSIIRQADASIQSSFSYVYYLADPTKSHLDGPTEAQVRAELKREEERDAASGKVPLHGTSATAFLTGGLQIEDAQYAPPGTEMLWNINSAKRSGFERVSIWQTNSLAIVITNIDEHSSLGKSPVVPSRIPSARRHSSKTLGSQAR